jgi:hypothetical protein
MELKTCDLWHHKITSDQPLTYNKHGFQPSSNKVEFVFNINSEKKKESIRPCGTSRVILHAVKSYDMGPSRFTSHPRGRFAADFIALKNPSPLGPVASTLTTTPPRRLNG